jgi:hypothetical protein
VLLEGSPFVLPPFPDPLRGAARRALERLGVEVRTECIVIGVDADGVTYRRPGQTLVSDPGVRPGGQTRGSDPGVRPGGQTLVSDPSVRPSSAAKTETPLDFVCEEDVRLAIQAGRKLVVSERAIVTPAARDLAEQHRVFSVAPWRG